MKLNPSQVARADQQIAHLNTQLDQLIELYRTSNGNDLIARATLLLAALTHPLGADAVTDTKRHVRMLANLLTVAINRLSQP